MSTNQLPDPKYQVINYPSETSVAVPPTPNLIGESATASWQLFLAFFTWVASWLLLLFVPLLVALPYLIYKGTQHTLQPGSPLTEKTVVLLLLLGVLPAHVLSVFVAWAVVTSWGRRPFWETIRWSWPEDFGLWKRLSLALLALVLFWLASVIARVLGGGETEIDQLINSSFAARITLAFLAAATAPFVEELIYRGVLYSALERSFGSVWAIVVVSVMFAGVHVLQYKNSLGVIAAIAVLSVSLTLVRAFTGRLLPCFVIHLVFNGIQSIYIVLSPYLDSIKHSDKAAGLTIHMIGLFIRQLG